MSTTEIEWATHVWNFTRGCRRVSLGCGGPNGEGGCYAEKTAFRFSGPGMPYEGLVTLGKHGPRWNGNGRFLPEKLGYPLSVRAPKDGSRHRFFVNSMSDLFFEAFSNEEIAAAFGVMAACPKHDFLILTKRPERMVEWFKWEQERHATKRACVVTAGLYCRRDLPLVRYERLFYDAEYGPWPLPNVWLGVSVENQATVDERIPLLLETPAAVRFISAEPLLGPIDLRSWVFNRAAAVRAAMRGPAALNSEQADAVIAHPLDWIIAGGESGPGARPCALEWLESIVEQCRESGTACFVKQLGACVVSEHRACESEEDAKRLGFRSRWLWRMGLQDKKGGDPSEWSQELQVRQFPEVR